MHEGPLKFSVESLHDQFCVAHDILFSLTKSKKTEFAQALAMQVAERNGCNQLFDYFELHEACVPSKGRLCSPEEELPPPCG